VRKGEIAVKYRFLSPVVFDRFSPFFVPDSGSGSGGGGSSNDDDDDDDDLEDQSAPPSTGNATVDAVLRDQFERNRSWLKAQRRKLGNYRRRARDAETALQTARSEVQTQPKVSKEDVDALAAYRALGTVDEVTTQLETGKTAAQEIATYKRDSVVRAAADATGYNFDVLRDRVGNQELLVREVDEDGQKVKRAFVKPEGGNEIALSEYAAQHWSAYLPALNASANGNGETGSRSQSQQSFPGQASAVVARQSNLSGKQAALAYTKSTYSGPPKRSA